MRRFCTVLCLFWGAWLTLAQPPAPTPTVAGVMLGDIATGTRVMRMSYSADGALLATLGYPLAQATTDAPPRLYVWDAAARQLLREVRVDGAVFQDMGFVGGRLLATTQSGEVIALETQGFAPVLRVKAHDTPALLAISPDGQTFATADVRGAAVWSANTLEVTGFLFPTLDANTPRWLERLFFAADGRTLGALFSPALFWAWDVASGAPLAAFDTGYTVEPYAAAFDEAGKLALAYGALELWERDGTRSALFPSGNAVYHAAFLGGGRVLLAEADGALNVWDTATRRIARVVRSGSGQLVTALALHPTLPLLAVAEDDGRVSLLALP